MKGSSKVVMGATMAIVVILAIVLGLVLVLLAELYCSLLFRRRKLNKATKPTSMAETPTPPISQQTQTSPLSSFYAQGVLDAPRNFLFPKLPSKREDQNDDVEKQQKHGKLHQFLRIQSPHQITKPEIEVEVEEIEEVEGKDDDFMYISNPIYDNDLATANRVDTPFETPDSSPTRLGRRSGFSGGEDDEERENATPSSLPLSPMKELPEKASSVELRDARCLGTSGSECNSHIGRFSSSSGTPCTSPSW